MSQEDLHEGVATGQQQQTGGQVGDVDSAYRHGHHQGQHLVQRHEEGMHHENHAEAYHLAHDGYGHHAYEHHHHHHHGLGEHDLMASYGGGHGHHMHHDLLAGLHHGGEGEGVVDMIEGHVGEGEEHVPGNAPGSVPIDLASFVPAIGQTFSSFAEIENLLDAFARANSFVIIIMRSQRPGGHVVQATFGCYKSGSYRPNKADTPNKRTIKTNCPFQINVRYSEKTSEYRITKVDLEHNHELDFNDIKMASVKRTSKRKTSIGSGPQEEMMVGPDGMLLGNEGMEHHHMHPHHLMQQGEEGGSLGDLSSVALVDERGRPMMATPTKSSSSSSSKKSTPGSITKKPRKSNKANKQQAAAQAAAINMQMGGILPPGASTEDMMAAAAASAAGLHAFHPHHHLPPHLLYSTYTGAHDQMQQQYAAQQQDMAAHLMAADPHHPLAMHHHSMLQMHHHQQQHVQHHQQPISVTPQQHYGSTGSAPTSRPGSAQAIAPNSQSPRGTPIMQHAHHQANQPHSHQQQGFDLLSGLELPDEIAEEVNAAMQCHDYNNGHTEE